MERDTHDESKELIIWKRCCKSAATPAPAPAPAPAPDPDPAPALGRVAPSGPGFLRTFGSMGSSKKKFMYPMLMAWDHQGNVATAL